mgnify:CR=1 FL=1
MKYLEEAGMHNAYHSPIQEALEVVEALTPEEQMTVIDIIRRRLVEQRRDEIALDAQATLRAVREGTAHFGSVDDLKDNLSEEP